MDQDFVLEGFLITTIATTCNLDPAAINLETSISDLGLDSLSLVSILSQVGMIYDVDITQEEIMEFLEAAHVKDVLALVERIAARTSAEL